MFYMILKQKKPQKTAHLVSAGFPASGLDSPENPSLSLIFGSVRYASIHVIHFPILFKLAQMGFCYLPPKAP